MTRRRPDFQFRVAHGSDLQQAIIAAIMQFHGRDRLLVAAIEALREAQYGGQRADRLPALSTEAAEAFVPLLRRRLSVIAGDERDGLDLVGLEATKIAVLD